MLSLCAGIANDDDKLTCGDYACDEIRACVGSYQCRPGGVYSRKNETEKDCCIRVAAQSTRGKRECRHNALELVKSK